MKEKNLMRKSLTQFITCTAILLVLAAPAFFWLTKNYYAEDMSDLIEAVQAKQPIPANDLEEDVFKGIMIQFGLIAIVLGIALVVTLQLINKRLWRSFDKTLQTIEDFRLEDQQVPSFPQTEIKEFARLNTAITRLTEGNIKSYRMQKEFTENASHELQTPLAVFQSKLDILLQQSDNITESQAAIIQDLYEMTNRLSRLNRNLLLLAKMENNQFSKKEEVDVVEVIQQLLPFLESLAGNLTIKTDFLLENHPTETIEESRDSKGTDERQSKGNLLIPANRSLLESLLNNLIVNAVRHNKPNGEITITLTSDSLIVSNTSTEKALDANLIFNRFYRPSEKTKGNGLGLAIVKAVCDYHGWKITYHYSKIEKQHSFIVKFCPK